MADDSTRIARRARRLGWTSSELGSLNDLEWTRFRVCAQAEDATNGELCDAIAVLLKWEESEAQFGTLDVMDARQALSARVV